MPLLTLLLSSTLIGLGALLVLTLAVWSKRARRSCMRYRQRPMPMTVVRRQDYTDHLFELELTPAPSLFPQLRRYLPGQFITLQGPLLASGLALERRYSLASWTEKPDAYRLCIKREAHGKMSNWLYERTKPGSILAVRPPAGEFRLSRHQLRAAQIVLVAAGVGITPLKAMVEWLRNQDYQGSVLLFQTARTLPELLYHEHFLKLAEHWHRFHYRPFLTGSDSITLNGNHTAGRITADELFRAGGQEAEYYFCASQPMIEALISSLKTKGVAPMQLHYELFAAVSGSSCGSYEVSYENRTLNAEGFPTLLQVLEALSAPIDTDCRAGTCGRCRIIASSGKLKHTVAVEPALRLPDQQYLACCSVPESAVTISLLTK